MNPRGDWLFVKANRMKKVGARRISEAQTTSTRGSTLQGEIQKVDGREENQEKEKREEKVRSSRRCRDQATAEGTRHDEKLVSEEMAAEGIALDERTPPSPRD